MQAAVKNTNTPSQELPYGLTERDKKYFEAKGKPLGDVLAELEALTGEQVFPQVIESAQLGNKFVQRPNLGNIREALVYFQKNVIGRDLEFVVPAAGAASRQMQLLKTILDHPALKEANTPQELLYKTESAIKEFSSLGNLNEGQKADLKSLKEVKDCVARFWDLGICAGKYGFCDDLDNVLNANGDSLQDVIDRQDLRTAAKLILNPEGLNYGNLPKLLMRFHAYEQLDESRECRLMLEEHIRESAMLLTGASKLKLHFPISQEHRELSEAALKEIWLKPSFSEFMNTHGFTQDNVQVTWSYQEPSTDSVALDIKTGKIARDKEGNPILRKAGHGTLNPNLSRLEAEGLWLQNVDNAIYDNPQYKGAVIVYKRFMAALATAAESKLHWYIKELKQNLDNGIADVELNSEIVDYLKRTVQTDIPEQQLVSKSPREVSEALIEVMDRPLLVAGYVPLEKGQAGGGPFVIETELGSLTVRKANTLEQAEFKGGASNEVFQSGSFFNPVEFFLTRKRWDGTLFDLSMCVDSSRAFISEKPGSGGLMRVYERPGLWNGSLAKALQISIPLPSGTFSAIKDLAGKESPLARLHQPCSDPLLRDVDFERKVVDQQLEEYLNSLGS